MKKILVGFKPAYRWKYYLTHPHEIFGQYWRELKWFIQRGLYGYADNSVWSIDYYLSEWMPSAVRELKEGHGWPGMLSGMDEWREILEKIALGFEADLIICDEWPTGDVLDDLVKVRKEGFELFIKYYNNLWD